MTVAPVMMLSRVRLGARFAGRGVARALASAAAAAPSGSGPPAGAVAGAGGLGEMKRMNLFTAINDAMRVALETDPTAVRGRRCVCVCVRARVTRW